MGPDAAVEASEATSIELSVPLLPDPPLRRFGRGEHASSIEMAGGWAGSKILEDRKQFAGADVSEQAGAANSIGKTVIFRYNTGQASGRSPPIDQRTKAILDCRGW